VAFDKTEVEKVLFGIPKAVQCNREDMDIDISNYTGTGFYGSSEHPQHTRVSGV
jgi:hypothetical protein